MTEMDESRKKILEMLSEGKISVEEATALLEKVSEPPAGQMRERVEASDEVVSTRKGSAPRFLRVVVDSSDGDKVNVRVPLSLIRTGIKLGALMPKNAAEAVSEHGFDLSALASLDTEELISALRELTVDVDSSDGDKVRVFTE
jgi:hypothetical protein